MSKNRKPLRVLLKPEAARWMRKCEPAIRRRIESALLGLGDDAIPRGAKRLVGESSFRIRVGDYRIVYEIRQGQLLILIVRIGHRRDVYKRR